MYDMYKFVALHTFVLFYNFFYSEINKSYDAKILFPKFTNLKSIFFLSLIDLVVIDAGISKEDHGLIPTTTNEKGLKPFMSELMVKRNCFFTAK
jgi:hypothetical protein